MRMFSALLMLSIAGCAHHKNQLAAVPAGIVPNAWCTYDAEQHLAFFMGKDGLVITGSDCNAAMATWKATPTPKATALNQI